MIQETDSVMAERASSTAEYMKIRRYVLNRIHRAGGKALQLPTAQELAKQFECSRPTVSKAMKTLTDDGYVIGRPGIGSFINPNIEGSQKGGNMDGMPIIGIIFGDGMVVHYEIFFGAVLARALEEVIHRPAVLHIINLTSTNHEKIVKEILAEDLDGLIWEGPVVDAKTILSLRRHGLPVVVMKSEPLPGCDCVYFDMDLLGTEIARRLLAEKRKNVVFLADRKPWNAARHSLLRTFAEAGHPLNEKLFLDGCETGLARLREFLELGVPVDAVVNPLFLVGKVLDIFDSLGIDRREKCRLVNNGIYRENVPVPGGLSYEPPIREYVAAAVNRVFALIADKTLPPEQISIPVPLVES